LKFARKVFLAISDWFIIRQCNSPVLNLNLKRRIMKLTVLLLTLTFLLSGATTIKATTTVDDPFPALLAPGVNSNETTTSTALEVAFANLVAIAIVVY
jgi:hypothetical protein